VQADLDNREVRLLSASWRLMELRSHLRSHYICTHTHTHRGTPSEASLDQLLDLLLKVISETMSTQVSPLSVCLNSVLCADKSEFLMSRMRNFLSFSRRD